MPNATPTLIQDVASSANPIGIGIEGNNFRIPLPNSVGAGNALVLALTFPHGSNPTITDSNGNIWPLAAAVSADAGVGGNVSAIWVLPNAHAGQTVLTVSFAEPVIPFNYAVSEFNNVDTANPVNGTSATADDVGASLSTGLFTPGNNDAGGGNLIYNYYAISGGANGNPTSWDSGGNFTLLDADVAWTSHQGFPHASQYFVQTTAAPINPSITAVGDSSDGFNGVAVALRAAPAGTPAPGGIHIDRIIHQTTTASPGSTVTLQVPTSGNLLVLGTAQANNVINITSITDSHGGVWTRIEPSEDEPQIWYSANRTPDPDLTVTVHYGSYTSGTPTMTALFYDISGAAANPFDVAAGTQYADISNQTVINDFPTITPTTPGGLVIAVMGDGQGPGLGLSSGSPSGAVFDLVTYAGETDLDLMENADGQAHLYYSSTATQHWNWNITANHNNGASATAAAFLSASLQESLTTNYPDGSRAIEYWDVHSQYNWSHVRNDYDNQGRLTSTAVDYDSGTRAIIGYDPTAQFDWADYRTDYNTQGQVTGTVVIYDNATRADIVNDAANQFNWADYRTDYDAQARVVSSAVDYDNGSRAVVGYDPQNQFDWSYFRTDYDTQGRVTDTIVIYDNGTRADVIYDAGNQFNWSYYRNDYDAQSHLIGQVGVYDDGTTWHI